MKLSDYICLWRFLVSVSPSSEAKTWGVFRSFAGRARGSAQDDKKQILRKPGKRQAQDDRLVIVGLTKINLSCH